MKIRILNVEIRKDSQFELRLRGLIDSLNIENPKNDTISLSNFDIRISDFKLD